MLEIKPLEKKKGGAHILTPYLADSLSIGSWLFYLGISWGCEQESEILDSPSKINEAETVSGQYVQSASRSARQQTCLLPSLLHTLSTTSAYRCGRSNDRGQSAQRTCPLLLRERNQIRKETQRLGERKAEDCLGLLLLSP